MSEGGDTSGYLQYKAIYDFDSRNPDELPFKAGDIIMVSFIGFYRTVKLNVITDTVIIRLTGSD